MSMCLGIKSPFFYAFRHPLLWIGLLRGKNFYYKIHVYSDLKYKLIESKKKVNKKLVKANKGCNFAPANKYTEHQLEYNYSEVMAQKFI